MTAAATTMTATIAPAATGLSPVLLASLSRDALGKLFVARFGFAMPASWNRTTAALAYSGESFPKGKNGKACATWHYTAKSGVAPAKSWTVTKLATETAKPAPAIPRSKGSKADAVAAYILATGYLPAKSWTIADIVAKTATKTLPARNAVKADAQPVAASVAA